MRTRASLLFSGLLLACSAHPASPTVGNRSEVRPPGGLPRAYAALFVSGTRWSYTTTHGSADEKSAGQATCRVVAVARYTGGIESQIECADLDPDRPDDPVTGVWVANDQGLWRLGPIDLPMGATPPLAHAELVLDATPVAKHSEGQDPDVAEYSWSKEVERQGNAWCYTWADQGGDASWSSVCIDEVGVKSGEFGWGEVDTLFTRVDR